MLSSVKRKKKYKEKSRENLCLFTKLGVQIGNWASRAAMRHDGALLFGSIMLWTIENNRVGIYSSHIVYDHQALTREVSKQGCAHPRRVWWKGIAECMTSCQHTELQQEITWPGEELNRWEPGEPALDKPVTYDGFLVNMTSVVWAGFIYLCGIAVGQLTVGWLVCWLVI